MELILDKAGVLIALIDPVIKVIDGDWFPRLFRELTLLGTAYCHQFQDWGEVFHVFNHPPSLFIDIQCSFMLLIKHQLLSISL